MRPLQFVRRTIWLRLSRSTMQMSANPARRERKEGSGSEKAVAIWKEVENQWKREDHKRKLSH